MKLVTVLVDDDRPSDGIYAARVEPNGTIGERVLLGYGTVDEDVAKLLDLEPEEY